MGMTAILRLGPAAVGQTVVVTAAPLERDYHARIIKAPAGERFVVVEYSAGTITELHEEEEGQMFNVRLASAA